MEPVRNGLVAVVKRDCPTCVLIAPVLADLKRRAPSFTVYSQDDPGFPDGLDGVIDDRALEASFRLDIEIVPTLIRFEGGKEADRLFGWNRGEWQVFTGLADLGADLPENRPGCGSKTQDPGMPARLQVRYGETGLAARHIEVAETVDPVELCYERGWTDGMPVIPPAPELVLEMLEGTSRAADEVVGAIPPNLADCTVEKVAINAVMAGCKPEYMDVLLTALELSISRTFNLHGLLATTNTVAPAILVNGPVAKAIGMNWGLNVFGQGNRANATIGRAFQLVVRNVGGGRPGEIDRAVFGSPQKYTFCFAEDETDGVWESFAESRGFPKTASTVTMFAGDGPMTVMDHTARTPEELCDSFAACLRSIYREGHVINVSAMLAVAYEHALVFYEAGWSKQRVKDALLERCRIPVRDLAPGRAGLSELTEAERADPDNLISKFHGGSLEIIRAGGHGGKRSQIISSIAGGMGMDPVTREIQHG